MKHEEITWLTGCARLLPWVAEPLIIRSVRYGATHQNPERGVHERNERKTFLTERPKVQPLKWLSRTA